MRVKMLILFLVLSRSSFGGVQSTGGLIISEFMASNSSIISDGEGDFSDWIEIWNNSNTTIDLVNWSLTDDVANPSKWTFPVYSLAAGEYLVVFASDKAITLSSGEFHTNFKLSASGEYLALIDPEGNIVCSFDPFPTQSEDISFGLLNDEYDFLAVPSPGTANSLENFLSEPSASHERGFYSQSIQVELTSTSENTDIYYTIDGSEPSSLLGMHYEEPIAISKTTVLRAKAFRDTEKSKALTLSYLFANDIINQSNTQSGYPATWGPYTMESGSSIADYEMDADIAEHPQYENKIEGALKSLPTVSLVTESSNFFSLEENPETGGIYVFTGSPLNRTPEGVTFYGVGKGWERPVSMEFFTSDGSESMQVDAGVRLHGGHSRRPEKSPKHSFRIAFREQYGPGKLAYPFFDEEDAEDKFNSIVLRAAFGNTWRHATASQRDRAQHIRDVWAKDTQLAMGQTAGHSRFVNLYINGLYWGVYNISERIDDDFMASYLKGKSEDFDVIKDYVEVASGNLDAWNHLWNEVNGEIESLENYYRLLGKNPDGTDNPNYQDYLEVNNLIDYILINFYGGNKDWDHHNWVAGRNRDQAEEGFQFYCWDTERILEESLDNVVDEYNAKTPSGIFQSLLDNDEFKVRLMDRIQLHFFNQGALTPQVCADRYDLRAQEVELAMIAESARWGDYRRDVHPWTGGPFELYTQEHWIDEKDWIINSYFPYRTETVLNQLRSAGMFPSLAAPTFNEYEGDFTDGFELTMEASDGVIYYTTNGNDPRVIGGEIDETARIYDTPLQVGTNKMKVEARVYENGQWSPKTEAKFNKEGDEVLKVSDVLDEPVTVNVYPNPFSSNVNIAYGLQVPSNVSIKICALDGRIIMQEQFEAAKSGNHVFEFNAELIPQGMYIYYLETSGFRSSGRIIKRG